MGVVDGISIRAIARSEFIRESISNRGYKLTKIETDVMQLIHDHLKAMKEKMIVELSEKIKNNLRFSLILEWTGVDQLANEEICQCNSP